LLQVFAGLPKIIGIGNARDVHPQQFFFLAPGDFAELRIDLQKAPGARIH
jgi:hypothetical protein